MFEFSKQLYKQHWVGIPLHLISSRSISSSKSNFVSLLPADINTSTLELVHAMTFCLLRLSVCLFAYYATKNDILCHAVPFKDALIALPTTPR
ncbi:hypothetical protein VTL71DRAFT_11257 [Oculimacula yallundae]|uniref:Uncharacterized protein n=1 Tax=Oculimacula yallundae TaxID=86028 RepID=A0ABR4CVG9_9HELO